MNSELSKLLYSLGITPNYTGYYYIGCAVELVAKDPARLVLVTKDLYPTIALYFSSTTSRVERNLRRAADLAWRTNPKRLQAMAGYQMSHRPCVSQFIAILSAEFKKMPAAPCPDGQQSFF